ncbi:MAG TPA: DUF2214 family protein [bacterium]
MATEMIVAYLHYIGVLGVAATLSAELLMLRPGLNAATAKLIQRVDGVYGVTALIVVVTGFMRVWWVGKGAAFYTGNPVFHALWILFVVIGLISILPTIQFMRWGKGAAITDAAVKKQRRIVMVEVHLLAIAPLLAVLMARGIGN